MKKFISVVRLMLFIFIVGIICYIFFYHLILHSITQVPKENIFSCSMTGHITNIAISDTGFVPPISTIRICDLIRVVNTGKKYHLPAFGNHEEHLRYPGFREKLLAPYQSEVIHMVAWGSYKIHDHIYDELVGEIIVQR